MFLKRVLVVILLLAEQAGTQSPATHRSTLQGPGYQYFALGNPHSVDAHPRRGVALMGGGPDQDAAFRWMCERAGGGDFVVLRATGTDAYNPYIKSLCLALNSVQTLIIQSRQGADQPFVIDKVRNAGAVFLAGGSQDNYVNFWQGTPLQAAINSVIARGVVGGTSAGLAVLAEYNFSALHDTIQSTEALANPFHERITLGRDFLRVPHLEAKITDSHFGARDRMGRLVAFLARIASDGWSRMPSGIGIDEKTAVLLEPDGEASVTGAGAAYFVRAPGLPEKCRPNTALTYRGLSVYRLKAGLGRFHLDSWTGNGGAGYTLAAENGVLHSSLTRNQIY